MELLIGSVSHGLKKLINLNKMKKGTFFCKGKNKTYRGLLWNKKFLMMDVCGRYSERLVWI